MYWMITNRNVDANKKTFGDNFTDLSYWQNASDQVDVFSNWVKVDEGTFRQGVVAVADTFPDPNVTPSEDQKHFNIFVHGFDNTWISAVQRYGAIVNNLFSGPQSLGLCVLFTWPSKGSVTGYFPDRGEARQSGDDFADVLSSLYDWMRVKQVQAVSDPANACKAKTSVIAHSMGNYVVENAMNVAWTRKNRPLLMSLISQFVMVAADVDNDLFRAGDTVQHGDGEGIANLTYRVTAMYSGRRFSARNVGGAEAFWKTTAGTERASHRLARFPTMCGTSIASTLLDPKLNGLDIHGAYFAEPKCYALMRDLLKGMDRTVLLAKDHAPEAMPKLQAVTT